MDMIVSEMKGPEYDPQKPFQMLVTDLSYNDYMGRLAIGKSLTAVLPATKHLSALKKTDSIKDLRSQNFSLMKVLSLLRLQRRHPGI
jgi:GTP-binding protein